jgi:hypothetical protein
MTYLSVFIREIDLIPYDHDGDCSPAFRLVDLVSKSPHFLER